MFPLPARSPSRSPTHPIAIPGQGPAAVTNEGGPLIHRARVDPLTSKDAILMGFGLGMTLLLCLILGYGRIFWEDEMLGWMLLKDPSWHHMIYAWKLGADGGGFLFYLSGRLWFWIFGGSEISFRMYSAMGFGLAFCVLWITMRRFYRRGLVAFSLFNTWFFSQTIVTHVAEGRFYGLLMLFTTLVVWLMSRRNTREHISKTEYLLYFLAHAALVTSHLLGFVYSATLLGALVLLDRLAHSFQWKLYATIASAWLLLIPEREAIIASAQVGKPHFWTTQPNFSRWVGAYSAYSSEIALVLIFLSAAAFISLRRSPAGWRQSVRQAFDARRVPYVVTGALLLVPIELFLEGFAGPSLFINRYFLPVAIAQAFLTAEAIELTDWSALPLLRKARFLSPALPAALFVTALLWWDLGHLAKAVMPRKNYTDALTARLPRNIPVLCEDAWAFTEIIGRQHSSGVLYTYLLDWPQSIGNSAPRLEVTQYHLMENWKKAGYFAGSIEYRDQFLEKYPRFLIFHQEPGPGASDPPFIGNPLLERFRRNPRFQVIPYARTKGSADWDLWLVCRGSCK